MTLRLSILSFCLLSGLSILALPPTSRPSWNRSTLRTTPSFLHCNTWADGYFASAFSTAGVEITFSNSGQPQLNALSPEGPATDLLVARTQGLSNVPGQRSGDSDQYERIEFQLTHAGLNLRRQELSEWLEPAALPQTTESHFQENLVIYRKPTTQMISRISHSYAVPTEQIERPLVRVMRWASFGNNRDGLCQPVSGVNPLSDATEGNPEVNREWSIRQCAVLQQELQRIQQGSTTPSARQLTEMERTSEMCNDLEIRPFIRRAATTASSE